MIGRNFLLLFCKYYGITYLYCRRFLIEYSFVNVSFFFCGSSRFFTMEKAKWNTRVSCINEPLSSPYLLLFLHHGELCLHYAQTSANNVSILDNLFTFSICNFSTSSQSNLLYKMNNVIESNLTNNYNTIFESITYVIINKTNLKQSTCIYAWTIDQWVYWNDDHWLAQIHYQVRI